MSTSGKKEWHANYPKGKFLFLARKFGLMDNFIYTGMLNQQHQPTLLKVLILWKMTKLLVGLRENFCVIHYGYCNVIVILPLVSSYNL